MKENPKREQVLRAGSECFARYGYEKTTLDDIGRRAGLNKASLYYYFKSKEEIFSAVVLAETQAFSTALQEATCTQGGAAEQLRFFLTERLRRYGEVIHLNRLALGYLQKLESLFDAVDRTTNASELTFLTQLLEAGQRTGAFQLPTSATTVAGQLLALSDAFKHDCMRPGGRFVAGRVDFSPAIERLEFWLELLLQSTVRFYRDASI